MPNSVAVYQPRSDIPRSPASVLTRSSGSTHSSRQGGVPPSISPLSRLSGKRAAPLNTQAANQVQVRLGDLALSSANSSAPSLDTPRGVCLCQPEPKIPRPRNAFILYRQHYQGQIASQHPGLANPEISKIIGEQWKEQPQAIKEDWKKLAEEEKLRHQRQYPGYRYQPRRGGKLPVGRPSSISPTDEASRCPKCGGRYISTPSAPHTPFVGVFGDPAPRVERALPSYSSSLFSVVENPTCFSQGQNAGMDSSREMPQQYQQRRAYPPQPLQSYAETDERDLSPGQKRRRVYQEPQRGYPSGSPTKFFNSNHFARNNAPLSGNGFRPPPPVNMLVRNPSMAPPQISPMNPSHKAPYSARSSTFDENLRLPPLQTSLPQVPLSSPTISIQRQELRRESREIQARSIEAMVMTISYAEKIKMLARIAPSLAAPGPTSPAQDIRGTVIAVEGMDMALTDEVGTFLNGYLDSESTCYVKTWSALTPCTKTTTTSPGRDVEMANISSPAASTPVTTSQTFTSVLPDPFIDYLTTISRWHKKSLDIIKYITSVPPNDPSKSKTSKVTPIALFPRGFSMTVSDRFAIQIPINDSYAPTDHWQWMATLWRGIIGPDFTVYVKRVDKQEFESKGGVEMRGDFRGVVVRVPEGTKMEEKTGRRLGFEVLEYVRGVEGGCGRS